MRCGGAERRRGAESDPIMQHSSVPVLLLVAPSGFFFLGGGFCRLHIDNKSQTALVQTSKSSQKRPSCLPCQFLFLGWGGGTAALSGLVAVPIVRPRCQILSGKRADEQLAAAGRMF